MKIFKSHFRYNKRQRNGIFYLLIVIISLQWVYHSFDSSSLHSKTNANELAYLQVQLDSLKRLNKKPIKVFKFNPNFITDAKGYSLGMSLEEIDRLLAYRKKNKWVNSSKEFQKVTKVSDSLLEVLKPQFSFPKFTARKIKKKVFVGKVVKRGLNTATKSDLIKINGIGEKLSTRIIKYRNLLGGFTVVEQLDEVWGLEAKVIKRIKSIYKIKKTPTLNRVNINTATFKEVLAIVYLDYKTTKIIFKYKDSVGTIKKIEELKKIEGFPIKKYDRIVLYLHAE